MDADGNCFPSQSEIADALRITRQAANERLKEILAFRWEGKPIVMACKVRGEGQKFSNTRYTILPVTGFQFGPGSPDQPMSTGGDMGGTQAMSSAIDKIHLSCAVPPSEDKPQATSSSGNPVPGSLEPEEDTARTRTRVNSARVRAKAPANRDVRTLLQRHAQCYQDKVKAPYPITWGKEGALLKQLLQTYSADELVSLQDTFFAQPADSQAAIRGYTVERFKYEAAALMSRIKLRERLTDEQRETVAALRAEGVAEETALALVTEHGLSDIQRQIGAHQDRKERLRNPAAALVKAVRENWAIPEEDEPDYHQPLPSVAPAGAKVGPPPPEIQEMLERTIAHLTGKEVAP